MKTVVIFSGRFQPFHYGHYKSYMHLLKKFPDADVYIGTSNKTDSEKSPFDFNEKKLIITRMFKIPQNRIVQLKNPYNPIEILSNYPKDSTVYITSVGEKDSERLGGKYFKKHSDSINLNSYKDNGYVYIAPAQSNAISGTDVRKWLSTADARDAEKNFMKAYPKFDKQIFDLIRNKLVGIREMSKMELDSVEKFADRELKPIDVDFGKEIHHFFQRLNDPRNGKPISSAELIGFFKRISKNKKTLQDFLYKYTEFVLSDRKTSINIPVKNQIDRLIAKTIMRKDDFKSPDPILKFENNNLNEEVFEDEIKATIESIDKAAKAAGFQLFRKPNIKPGKSRTAHATWIHKSVDGMKMRDIEAPYVSLVWSKGEGFTIVAKPAENSSMRKSKNGFVYGTTDEWLDKKKWSELFGQTNESILLEGGAYGHMAHPFDVDMNLTFGDLKQIVKSALNGELELAREKTDGQALAISWKNGKLISARNKGHLVNAGENAMSEQDLINKFAGRGAVSDAFSFAIKDLKNAISQLPESSRTAIFKEGKSFMNCEVIYPENTNVIPYGQSLLVFHGTMEYDERGNPISENPSAGFQLADMVKRVNANVQSKFSLQGPPIQTLPKSEDLVSKQPYYLSKIQKLQNRFNLNDGNGVEDYHQAWWSEWIDNNAPKRLDAEIKEGLVRRWAFLEKSFRLNQIQDTDVRTWAERVDKQDQQKISKSNLMKFEEIFLGVGADVLSFMTSVLVANPNEAKREIVEKLKKAISTIRATGDAKNLIKLELELKRLESLGGFDKIVPNEGIVFNYKGNTYKLTGAFAPLNQIMGIFTFTR